jgi:membrane protease YdiL (CAAX protease family)
MVRIRMVMARGNLGTSQTKSMLGRQLFFALVALLVLAGLADWIANLQLRLPAGQYFAVFASLSLILGAFVALTDSLVISRLRGWACASPRLALGIPLLLLIPYFIYGLGTGVFSGWAFFRLLAYIAVPSLLLLPDRLSSSPPRLGWRDCAAMLALGVPVAAGWNAGIWTYPFELYFFWPLYSVCAGVYAFVVIRNLQGVGYRLVLRKSDLIAGSANLLGFVLLAIPLGYALHFIRFHWNPVSPGVFGVQLVITYLTVAIPEELLFRGILQNFLEKTLSSRRSGFYALAIVSPIFGAAHLHHPPVPNWKYGLMATLAGLFYGNAYRKRHRISSSAFMHALVDSIWHAWF